MRMLIRTSGGWPPAAIELVRTRLEFALGRFTGRVRSLRVTLKDLNGPRGGLDKHCRIAIRLDRPARLIVIEDVDSEPEAAISRAAERAARTVTRAIDAATSWRPLRATPVWRQATRY